MSTDAVIDRENRNVWDRQRHSCYFCHPEEFTPMLPKHTLCARCGALIEIPDEDPRNMAMRVCPPCDEEIERDLSAPSAPEVNP